jgi:hypothetical protein
LRGDTADPSNTVRSFVLAQPGLAHVDVASDLDLLRKLVETIGLDHDQLRAPRWSHVGACLGHGSGVSQAICNALGLDPDKLVGGEDEPDEPDEAGDAETPEES